MNNNNNKNREMEANAAVMGKRLWNVVQAMFYMVRKGISKRKMMVDLNLMMKRGKIAGKAIHNLMFHPGHPNFSSSNRRGHVSSIAPHDYEFSCSNTPAADFFHVTKRKSLHLHSHFFGCAHAPRTSDDDALTVNAVKRALEMLNSEASSPALPGFGRTPAVRQLRITDSPFPLQNVADEDGHVDEAAEEFISRFYSQLRQQNMLAS